MFSEANFLTSYETWFHSAEGALSLECALALTKEQLSPWPRRGKSLLLMGFSHWKTIDMLWEGGHDITVYAPTEAHAHMAHHALNSKAHILTGNFEQLPFDDAYFDYVVLMPSPQPKSYPPLKLMLREARRLCQKGLLFQCWNPASPLGLRRRFLSLPPFLMHGQWYSWRKVHNILHNIAPEGRIRTASVLHTPFNTWKVERLKRINTKPLRHCLGALIQFRLSLDSNTPLTGMPLLQRPFSMSYVPQRPVLERRTPCQSARDGHNDAQ